MSGHDWASEPHETAHEKLPVPNCAAQWTRWTNVKPHPKKDEKPARERRTGPRNNWSTKQ